MLNTLILSVCFADQKIHVNGMLNFENIVWGIYGEDLERNLTIITLERICNFFSLFCFADQKTNFNSDFSKQSKDTCLCLWSVKFV